MRPERPAVVVPLSRRALPFRQGRSTVRWAPRRAPAQRPCAPSVTRQDRAGVAKLRSGWTRRLPARSAVSCNSMRTRVPARRHRLRWPVTPGTRGGATGELGNRPCGPVGGPKDSGDGACIEIQAGLATDIPARPPQAPPRRRGPRSGGGNANRRKPAHCKSTFLRLPGHMATHIP